MDGNMYSIREIREIIRPIARKYGVERMYLFGSYAKGTSRSDSDIDLRVDKGRVQGLQMAGLLLDLEEKLQKHVDLISTNALDMDFLLSIKDEEKLIYEDK